MEKMNEFFAARVDSYEEHMLSGVEGSKEAYIKMAQLLPKSCKNLLDLGCGTGLELDEIFKLFPDLDVIGIDLTQEMLDKLMQKHPDKHLNLICGSYFDVDLGKSEYDCAVSFQTLHHFSHEIKIGLYRKLIDALKPGSCYIECDYMVETQEEEDLYYSENARKRKEQGIPDGEFYHYDTPCTVQNQIEMLRTAGFKHVEMVFRISCTTILAAENLI
ncbi:MAG TPA: class I SAM-dependent methyltransferase [Oscillospiraceae bacterium]|nr:class I SAM-dependent methyltransferase [Oscillospiraceae bacterium]HPS34942.1 class I SAM-dependent methyltransferase [Oscillospiraceae bacterium]